MDAKTWWRESTEISRELLRVREATVVSVGVGDMGPCVSVADSAESPLRPAILYGVDTRAVEQIASLSAELGESEIGERCGCALSTQSVGPKLEWLADAALTAGLSTVGASGGWRNQPAPSRMAGRHRWSRLWRRRTADWDPQGVPVIGGTIDAWSEALSVGAHHAGDLMLALPS